MSSRNICFNGDIRKLSCGYPVLSAAVTSNNIICGIKLFFVVVFFLFFSLSLLLIFVFVLYYYFKEIKTEIRQISDLYNRD